MYKFLSVIFSVLVAFVLSASTLSATPEKEDSTEEKHPESNGSKKTELLLMNSRVFIESGLYAEARKLLIEALARSPQTSQNWKDARIMLLDVTKIEREAEKLETKNEIEIQMALLDDASMFLKDAKYEEASKIINDVIKKTKYPAIISKGKELLKQTHTSVGRISYKKYGRAAQEWIIYIIYTLILVFMAYIILRLIRWGVRKYKGSNCWVLVNFVDNTEYGIRELIIASLQRFATEKIPVTAGLLHAETSEMPAPFILSLPEEPIYLELVIQSAPAIGNVNIGAIAKIFNSIRNWFKFQPPWISGIANVKDGMLFVRLTRRAIDGKTKTVSESCIVKDANSDKAIDLSESVSFKMFYLLSNDCSISEADKAAELRRGIKILGKYISGIVPSKLDEAGKLFSRIRKESPILDEVHLYEGIALDLSEKHNEAIKHFKFVSEHAKEEKLRERAYYNEAISVLRKYEPLSLDKAINLLDKLIGETKDIATNPIKTLALAAKADAIAHKPLFWKQTGVFGTKVDDIPILELKRSRLPQLKEWISSVENITKDLQDNLVALKKNDVDSKQWDNYALRQLEWAIHNAHGDLYLNCANNFLDSPHLPEPYGPERRLEFFRKAELAFEKCEMLMPPGVETLCNFGALYLFWGQYPRARDYLNRAIKLNENYEYAYYRLAQTWEKEENVEEVINVLKSFKKDITISGFKKIFSKYQPSV